MRDQGWAALGLVLALLTSTGTRSQSDAPATAAARFERLLLEQREALRARLREYKALPKEGLQRIRANLVCWRDLPRRSASACAPINARCTSSCPRSALCCAS